jgi:hypothetical protein
MKTSFFTRVFFLCNICVLSFCNLIFPDFQWPLKEKTYITGSFGEFRKDHIHAGVDISTKGKTGLPVYAGETGLLHRIKIQYKGYGKAVYLKLQDGKFLVYAHLDRFSPEIEKIAYESQTKNGTYSIDINPKEKLLVKMGDLIGYSGDTGGVAPHVHIELRDRNENPINILKQGFNIYDKTPPKITDIAMCDTITSKCIQSFNAEKIPPEIEINGPIGLAVAVHDNSFGNKIGVYQMDLIIDEKLFFTVKMDKFSYDQFNDNFFLCNKNLYVNKNRIFYHLFKAFDNNLPFYVTKSNGILLLDKGRHTVEIRATDNAGNSDSVRFNIFYNLSSPPEKPQLSGETLFSSDKLIQIKIEKEDLYYPLKADIEKIQFQKLGELIPIAVYNIKPKDTIFKKAFVIVRSLDQIDKTGIYEYKNKKWKIITDGLIRNFNKIAVFKDITPPTIKITSTYPIFRAIIDDKGSGLNYEKLSLYIDKQKVIAEYSINRKELFYKMPSKGHNVICITEDMMGNLTKCEVKN